MRYHAAYAAYQACLRAVVEATMAGSLPSATLLEHEAKALGVLKKLRASLMAAMADGPGGSESQPGG